MLQLKVEIEENKNENLEKTEHASLADENSHEQSSASDKYPAPSTPQLKQGERLLDDGDCQDHTNCSIEKETGEQEGESKSAETTSEMAEETLQVSHPQSLREAVIMEEDELADGVKSKNNLCPHLQNKDSLNNSNDGAENPRKASDLHNSGGMRANRKKLKVTELIVNIKHFLKLTLILHKS